MPRARIASYWLLAALFVVVVAFRLGPALLAGVFCYTSLEAAHGRMSARYPRAWRRSFSLALVTLAALGAVWGFWSFVSQTLEAVPAILDQAMPRLAEVALRYGVRLPFENMQELRDLVLVSLKQNARGVTATSGLMTKRVFHLVIGVFAAGFFFMAEHDAPAGDSLYDALRREINARMRRFMDSFERVMGAQVVISGINTGFTAVFLLTMRFPHAEFLIPATFILGCLPVVGNLASNTIITCTALTVSPRHAVFALGFLIVIHKLEYILNSRIVGSTISAPTWQTLLGILVGEAVLGVPGVVLAPAILHYARAELQQVPASRP